MKGVYSTTELTSEEPKKERGTGGMQIERFSK
jgi:hypothetical protein